MLPPGVCLSTLVLRVSSWKEAEISGATEIENHSCLLPVIFSVLFYFIGKFDFCRPLERK